MKKLTHSAVLAVAVLIVLAVAHPASAANPYASASSLEMYLKGHADIGKSEAAMVNAQAAMVTSAATARAAQAKAIEEIQKVRAIALENELKAAKAFYDLRKLYADYQAQHAPVRPDAETLAKRGKAAVSRATAYQVDPLRGRIFWPSVLKRDEFADARVQMDTLFSQRKTCQSGLGSNFCRQAKELAGTMRDQLKDLMSDLSPAEYLAARKFLDTLALEAEMPARVEGVAAR